MSPICAFETPVSRLATDAGVRKALASDPQATLTAHELTPRDEEEGELLAALRLLLALPAEDLLQRLLGSDPGGDSPTPWDSLPPLAACME